jgi:predicted XRE-type DNA-binding protein
VVHAFQKKSTQGIKTSQREIELIKDRLKRLKEMLAMKTEKLEVARGSGNVFRDLGHRNADAEQFKGILAAEIIKALDREHLSVRAAHDRTGIAAADFSRIRNADLGRFTVDRLMSIINRLGSRVEVKVRVHRAETVAREVRAVRV